MRRNTERMLALSTCSRSALAPPHVFHLQETWTPTTRACRENDKTRITIGDPQRRPGINASALHQKARSQCLGTQGWKNGPANEAATTVEIAPLQLFFPSPVNVSDKSGYEDGMGWRTNDPHHISLIEMTDLRKEGELSGDGCQLLDFPEGKKEKEKKRISFHVRKARSVLYRSDRLA